MIKSRANLTVVGNRAATLPVSRNHGPVSTDLLARAQTITQPYGFTGTRRHGNKASMKGAQRNSLGQRSEWLISPYPEFTDPKWSHTLSNQP